MARCEANGVKKSLFALRRKDKHPKALALMLQTSETSECP